ncbi:MAG: hydrogenase assembly protein HypC [Dictyoglomus sp. NZ13-RE01]|nr:MAG: hydrogenase assembly protein HypC [Dictyoglomus sp. NZ13-RE01]
MCLGYPLKVLKLKDNNMADVDMGGGTTLEISTIFTPEVKEGDYVIVHAGFAISVLREDEAKEILELLEEK